MDSRSKYANLPFVAVGERDVFETDDLPEADQMSVREPLFDASIDVISCGTLEAFQRFNDKKEIYLEKTTNESVLEKYNRLSEETKALIDSASKETNESDKELVAKVSQLSDQLQELQVMRFNNTNTLNDVFESIDKSVVQSEDKSDGNESELKYKLWFRPQKNKLNDCSKVNSLEQRIKTLETVLGTNDNKYSILNNCLKDRSIAETVQELSAKVSQLDQSSLERVDSRLHMITDKLSQIAERKTQFEEMEKISKINELFDLMNRSEKSRAILPNVLQRLQSLSELQEQALQFSSCLSYMDSIQTQITDSLGNNEKQLNLLKDSLDKNVESIKQILLDFDKRLRALK